MTSGFVMMAAAGTARADDNSAPKDHKVYVCKVVGGPGNNSHQTGQNPIHVSENAIGDDVRAAGSPFNDAQPSVVLDYDGVGEPDVDDCPGLPPPPSDCPDDSTSRSGNTPSRTGSQDSDNDECVTAVDPKVDQSSKCEVEGTYKIYDTKGVDYFLDRELIDAGTYDGPERGTVTAKAEYGFELSNPDFSYDLNVKDAEDCPTPVKPDPIVVTTTVPSVDCTTKVVTITTTTTTTDWVLQGQTWVKGNPVTTSVVTTRAATEQECPPGVPQKPNPIVTTSSVPSTDCVAELVTTVTTTTTTDYVLVGNQWVLGTPVTTTETTTRPATDQECPEPPVVAPVDECPNIEGNQPKVPKGMTQNSDGDCVKPDVAGTEAPKPTKKPTVKGTEAVPTAVAAGLPGGPTFTSSSPTDLFAKSMVGAGLALLMAAGWLQIGRQTRGVHQV